MLWKENFTVHPSLYKLNNINLFEHANDVGYPRDFLADS